MSAIKTAIGVLLEQAAADTPAPLHRLMLTIERATNRMDQLVHDLLELARLEAGHTELRRAETDLREPAESAARLIEPVAQARQQELRVELPPEPVWATVDAPRWNGYS